MRVQVENDWNGWDGDTIVELSNGQFYRQSEYHYEYMYAYRPQATLDGGVLHVDGMSCGVRVDEINPTISRVSGEWTGWEGETEVELDNGQVWQQVRHKYEYKYKYRPRAMIFDNHMLVEGMSCPVKVRRLK